MIDGGLVESFELDEEICRSLSSCSAEAIEGLSCCTSAILKLAAQIALQSGEQYP